MINFLVETHGHPAGSHRYHLPVLKTVRTAKPARVAAWLLGIGIVFIVLVLTLTPWVQNVSGAGRVIAVNPNDREQRIAAPLEGRVVKWHVMEGSRVKKGDLVVEFGGRPVASIDDLHKRLTAGQAGVRSLVTIIRHTEKLELPIIPEESRASGNRN